LNVLQKNIAFRSVGCKELLFNLTPEVEASGDPTRAIRQRAEVRRPPPTARKASPGLHHCAEKHSR